MSRPRLLDLFCGGGGAGMGYYRAGFDVVGIDIARQPNYPFFVHQGDAIELARELLQEERFDAIHASPPCQAYTQLRYLRPDKGDSYPRLIEPVREFLRSTGLPYAIEGVVNTPLIDPLTLCGTEFGLIADGFALRRHRLFESNVRLRSAGGCQCTRVPIAGLSGHPPRETTKYGSAWQFGKEAMEEAMGITWMSSREIGQAIPPAYTEHIGKRLMLAVEGRIALLSA